MSSRTMDVPRYPVMVYTTLLLISVWISGTSGIKACDKSSIVSIFANSCKFKRSHGRSFLDGSHPSDKVHVPSYEAEIHPDEVLEILTNGIYIMKILSQDLKSYSKTGKIKKETIEPNWLRTNELPNSVEDGHLDPDLPTIYPGSAEAAKLWKRLMKAANRKGGKIRRDVHSAIYKCCSIGCNESDFVHWC